MSLADECVARMNRHAACRRSGRVGWTNGTLRHPGEFRRPKWRPVDDSDTYHYFDRVVPGESSGRLMYGSACGLRLEMLGGQGRRRPPASRRCPECDATEMAAKGCSDPLPADEDWRLP